MTFTRGSIGLKETFPIGPGDSQMARRKKQNTAKAKGKRGRKPIFSGEQKRVLERMIRTALKEQLRGVARGL